MLQELIPTECLPYVRGSGAELVGTLGNHALRKIVAGVLCGENVRTATEPLTRQRLARLNAAVLVTLMRASQRMSAGELLRHAHRECRALTKNDPRRAVLLWVLSLTQKQVQNVLRSDDDAWSNFISASIDVAHRSAAESRGTFDALRMRLVRGEDVADWDWLWIHTLMAAVGSQTLGTRGSEKSMYGKFFEKLIMSSVLELLGFRFDGERRGSAMSYWLSDRSEKRESDATALVGGGQGIRFDIGFIGPGNPEITLDKVSRFERTIEVGGSRFQVPTVIIVDRVAAGSTVMELAEQIDGTIIQMSSSLWAKDLDQTIERQCHNYERTFAAGAAEAEIREIVAARVRASDLARLLRVSRG